MFFKNFTLVFFVFVFSCNNNSIISKKQAYTIDTTLINNYITENNISKALSLADKGLNSLSESQEFTDYIYYNQWFVNKLKANNLSPEIAYKYYQNIFLTSKVKNEDTASLNSITNAYYWWSEFFYQKNNRLDDSVIICLEKAVSLNKKIPSINLREERYAYKMLGILYNKLGDLKKTLAYYSQQKKLIELNNFNALSGNANNMAIVLKEMGKVDSAITISNEALLFPNVEPMKKIMLLTTLSECQIQRLRLQEANQNLTKAKLILDTLKPTNEVYEKQGLILKNIGIIAQQNNDYLKAIQSEISAIDFYKISGSTNGRDIAKIFIELGKSYQANTQYDSALKYYQIALQKVVPVDSVDYFSNPLPTQLYAENTIMEALDAKANVLQQKFKQIADTKYLIAAINCYKISFEVERKLMQNFSYDESRMLMLKESKKRSEQAIAICHNLFITTKNNNWANEAFLFAEKSKAFVLLESVKRNIASNTILQNDSNYQRIQYLNARIAFLDKETILLHGNKTDSLKAIYEKQKTILNNELLLANNELTRNNAAYQIMNNKEDSLSIVLAQQNILDNNTAFIEFFAGDSATYIFSFTKNTNCTFFKTTDTIAKTLNSYLSFFTDKNKINNNPTAYQTAAHTLYTQLNFVAIDNTAITKYIIIPDGGFNLLPVEALVTTIKTENNPKYFDYVLLHKQINYNYSAANILKQMEYQSNVSNNTTTCFAPVFANNERGNTPLLHTIEEFDAIKKETNNGQYFLQQQATIGNFKKQLKTAGIVHIATHANANVANGIQQPQIEFYDSTLYLNELYAMHINPNLVVLSACQTGIGEIDKSEGAMSLARGFYYAGAKNIITSLWSVDDKSTATIFSNFYQQLANTNYNLSLHNAKLNYLKNTTVINASPYYWAGFVHIGYQMPPKKNIKTLAIIISISSILLLAAFYSFKRKRKQIIPILL